MPISLPQFNVNFAGWLPGNFPSVGPHDFNVMGQLYVHSRMDIDRDPGSATNYFPNILIRVPDFSAWGIPAPYTKTILKAVLFPGVKFGWRVNYWEVCHLNFPNQYVMLFCDQCDDNGVCPDAGR